MVVGVAGGVHLADELAQSRFLAVTALQNQVHALQSHAVGRGSAVVGGVGQRVHGALERHKLLFVDRIDGPCCDGGTLGH